MWQQFPGAILLKYTSISGIIFSSISNSKFMDKCKNHEYLFCILNGYSFFTMIISLRIYALRGAKMFLYVSRRLISAIITLLFVITITFFLMHAVPVDLLLGKDSEATNFKNLNENMVWISSYLFNTRII